MQATFLLPICLLATIGVAGCQTAPRQGLATVVPIYATKAEAQAVALGQFGAVPITMIDESEIDMVLSIPCAETAAAVNSPSGKQGWIPVNSLPGGLQNHCATPTK